MPALDINGTTTNLDIPDDMPLLWAIRDVMGLTGTKFGCGVALCGACTVHLDGQPIRSCVTPVSAAAGKKITTIEAIGNDPVGAKVQDAWRQVDVVQCGYCQSGQIMSATALLQANAKPSDADIDNAMAGNICRCGTYGRIRKAIKIAAGIPSPAVAPAAQPARARKGNEERTHMETKDIGFAPRLHEGRRRGRRRPAVRLLAVRLQRNGKEGQNDRKEPPSEKAVGQAATAASNERRAWPTTPSSASTARASSRSSSTRSRWGRAPSPRCRCCWPRSWAPTCRKVKLEQAPADNSLYADPLLGGQVTGGSTSVRGAWKPLREAGAKVRTVLVQAAAQTWKVDEKELSVVGGTVRHAASNRSAHFGELADAASKLQFPKTVTLKDAADFTLIGKSMKRLDSPVKVNGQASSASTRACPTWASRR
jgi:isoquinoline 1-oxidoreductase alpha subunit